MNSPDAVNHSENLVKARILNRTVARTIDLLIVIALHEIIPRIGYFAGLTYLLIADGLFKGQSVGKRLIRLKVILCEADRDCGFKESIIRNFPFAIGYLLFGVLKGIPLLGWMFSIIILALILSFEWLLILGNEKGMRFGDEIARTQVIEESKEG